MRLATIAFAAGLVLTAGAVGLPQAAEAGKRGHFSFSVPGFSLYIDKRHHGRHYRRDYRKHRYYGRHHKRGYWRYKHRRYKRHHKRRHWRRW